MNLIEEFTQVVRDHAEAGNIYHSPILFERLENLKGVEDFRNIVKISLADGTWNYDPYFHGMANGLILALHMLEGNGEPKFLDAPEQWLSTKRISTLAMDTEQG